MMEDTADTKGSWWKTAPGLTAIAGVVTAISGLIVALYQVGLLGAEHKTSTEIGSNSSPPISSDPWISRAKTLAKNAFVISPNHIDARGHLESRSPRICVGSEIDETEWRNLLRAYRLSEEITIWSLSLDHYDEYMIDGTCLLTIYSPDQKDAAERLTRVLDLKGDDPPYRSEEFLGLFTDREVGFR